MPRAVLFAVTVIAAVAAFGCGTDSPSEAAEGGQRVYAELGCGSCHGTDLAGTASAPPLDGLAAHWNADDLVRYLRDPAAVRAERPRLQYRAEQYALEMPGHPEVPEADLRTLAEYLLSQ